MITAIPKTLSFDEAWAYLNSFEPKPGEYVKHNLKRFLLAIDWLPLTQAKILDIGSDKYFVRLLKYLRPGFNIYCTGLVIARGAPDDWRRAASDQDRIDSDVKFQEVNVECDKFPYEEGFFDIVLCMEVIEHLVINPRHMVFEINRVIKKEGKLFLSSPNIASWRAIINVINGIYPMEHMKYHPHLGFPQHIREYMPWEIAQFLEEAGFQIEKIRTYEVTSRKLNFWEHMLSWCLSLIIIFSSRHPKFLFLRAPKIFVMAKKYTEPAHNAGAFLYI